MPIFRAEKDVGGQRCSAESEEVVMPTLGGFDSGDTWRQVKEKGGRGG